MYDATSFSIYAIEKTRENFLAVLDSMTLEKLNKVYPGFNNTGAWNFCHAITTSLLLTSGIAGIDTGLTPREMAKFRKGSGGSAEVTPEEMERFRDLAKSSLEAIRNNYTTGVYSDYQPYETSYGVKLHSIEEALHFIGVHEALHLGYLMAIRRCSEGQE